MIRFLFTVVAATASWTVSGCLHAETFFRARLDASQVQNNASDSTATGRASFRLNEAATHLAYSLSLDGLDLKPTLAERTEPNDVLGIHIHLHVADVIGPHILNIFGFPSKDDGDLVVDYQNNSLSGVYDMSDGLDPDTGEPFFQDDPLATKLIANWIDELQTDQLYIAVHSRERSAAAPPGVAIRGDIRRVPEPSIFTICCSALLACCFRQCGVAPSRVPRPSKARARDFKEIKTCAVT